MRRNRGTFEIEGGTMRIWICLGILMASTVSAYATPAVPEIDAFSGLAAMGVVGSIAALIWERRRK
jgi:hypothetical protein